MQRAASVAAVTSGGPTSQEQASPEHASRQPAWRDPARRSWRVDAALLALAAVLLRIPAFFASRHLTFDDGQYGTVVLGLRHGDLPFRDLFSSQGPLYYPLLGLADLIGLRTMNGARLLPVAAGAVTVVATYAIGRRVTSRGGALLAGGLVATSGSLLYVTAPLSGDGPALALAVLAVALAFRYRSRPSTLLAVGIGLSIGAALCVKLIVVPAAIPVGLLLLTPTSSQRTGSVWRERRVRDFLVAVATAIVVFLAAALPWGIERVWDQSVLYHQDSKRLRSYGGNLSTLLRTLVERDPFVVAAAAASLATIAVVAWRLRTARRAAPAGVGGPGSGVGPAEGAAVAGAAAD
ncbi:MAG: glycosyltransferase family 39 protein, partial [Acidimicrobiia bacterium]|nr:glycosyltransferase family 39 protein [Acidimicrobiia bacterium]